MKKGFVKVLGLILGSFMCFSCAQASGGDDGSAGTAGGSSNNGSSTVSRFPYGKYQFVRESGIYPVDFSENSEEYLIQPLENNQVRIKSKLYSKDYTYGWSTVGTTLFLSGYINAANEDYTSISNSTDLFSIAKASNCPIYYNKDTKVFRLDRVTDSGNGGGNDDGGSGAVSKDKLKGEWNCSAAVSGTKIIFGDSEITNSKKSTGELNKSVAYSLSGSKLTITFKVQSGNSTVENSEDYEISVSDNKLVIKFTAQSSAASAICSFTGVQLTESLSQIELTK